MHGFNSAAASSTAGSFTGAQRERRTGRHEGKRSGDVVRRLSRSDGLLRGGQHASVVPQALGQRHVLRAQGACRRRRMCASAVVLGHAPAESTWPRQLLLTLGMMVTRLAWMAASWASSNMPICARAQHRCQLRLPSCSSAVGRHVGDDALCAGPGLSPRSPQRPPAAPPGPRA